MGGSNQERKIQVSGLNYPSPSVVINPVGSGNSFFCYWAATGRVENDFLRSASEESSIRSDLQRSSQFRESTHRNHNGGKQRR